jgi:hypothetical protein
MGRFQDPTIETSFPLIRRDGSRVDMTRTYSVASSNTLNIISVYFFKNCQLDLGVRVAYGSSARPGHRSTPSRD